MNHARYYYYAYSPALATHVRLGFAQAQMVQLTLLWLYFMHYYYPLRSKHD